MHRGLCNKIGRVCAGFTKPFANWAFDLAKFSGFRQSYSVQPGMWLRSQLANSDPNFVISEISVNQVRKCFPAWGMGVRCYDSKRFLRILANFAPGWKLNLGFSWMIQDLVGRHFCISWSLYGLCALSFSPAFTTELLDINWWGTGGVSTLQCFHSWLLSDKTQLLNRFRIWSRNILSSFLFVLRMMSDLYKWT